LAATTVLRPVRAKKRAARLFGPAGVFAAIVCVIVLFVWERHERAAQKAAASNATGAADRALRGRDAAPERRASANRQPIELLLAPAGARIVLHLRPARLWTSTKGAAGSTVGTHTSRPDELLQCVGPLGDWARDQIYDRCLYPPSQIDEVVFAFGLRSPGEPPDVSALVRLAKAATPTEIEQRFSGTRSDKGSLPVFIKGDRALVIRDGQSFAVGPAESSQEMVDARDRANPTDASIEELLKETDRSRDLTIVFRPDDLDRFRDSLSAPQWSNALHELARWLDPEAVEGTALSIKLDDSLRVQLLVRTQPVVFGPRLAETLKQRLDRLPTDMVAYVTRLQPAGPGVRKLIGRLPAMCKAVALGTAVDSQRRLVNLESVLPERAAPNLSLATYLLLTEGPSRQDRVAPAPVATRRETPKSITARLQSTVDVDFRRTPLSEAFEAIGADIGVTFELDGGAFKSVGYTKNMPQTFQLKGVPAIDSIRKILKAYPKMTLIADEARNTIVVTTQDGAAARGKKPLEIGN
jgi:hypothetical protein